MRNLVHRALIVNMDIQPLGLVIHRTHRVGLEHTVLFWQIGLGKRLAW